MMLGAGEDGHTASLFPGSWALREKKLRAIAVVGPKPPPQRITLAPAVLTSAKLRVVAATGAGKADAIARALATVGTIDETPLRLGRAGVWFIDRAAATKIA
jgi:6-phosphogluconolactonase